MSWTNVKLIYLRELRDQLRDRRTLFTIVVLPLLLYPLMGMSVFQVQQFLKEHASQGADRRHGCVAQRAAADRGRQDSPPGLWSREPACCELELDSATQRNTLGGAASRGAARYSAGAVRRGRLFSARFCRASGRVSAGTGERPQSPSAADLATRPATNRKSADAADRATVSIAGGRQSSSGKPAAARTVSGRSRRSPFELKQTDVAEPVRRRAGRLVENPAVRR